ncbi:Sec-independent protein translocase protein TatB [Aerosticca soli]|jgi:sec-independent protein translocase protein TatB|uniref:Sec-independent protein translocase protein TatB n=1 Tax=Aerosticca soli TaxID=2010829 RepID=A0A2Z6E816_9GAMM|nr:Sec-independent protein translocase protein TatB [Aerosticca soli]MDI3262184.1 Sec-independent protein translocase protein TatB [Fulvimonas sp.]BBD80861.1 twin-arginine translocation protein TatB [Aerosticca soli]
MIEISFTKLLLLAVVALIVLGPEKLPEVARTAGAVLRRLRQSWEGVRAEVERELEVEELRRAARQAAAEIDAAQARLDAATRAAQQAAAEVREATAAAQAATASASPTTPRDEAPAIGAGGHDAADEAGHGDRA